MKEIISNHLDILILVEIKLDDSFPNDYMINRNKNGGEGVIIYIKNIFQVRKLGSTNLQKNVEGLFIEVNLRKTKLLLFGSYHSTHQEYDLSDADYFEQICLALDVYSNYDKFLIVGD